jgi:hypothetical protein
MQRSEPQQSPSNWQPCPFIRQQVIPGRVKLPTQMTPYPPPLHWLVSVQLAASGSPKRVPEPREVETSVQ